MDTFTAVVTRGIIATIVIFTPTTARIGTTGKTVTISYIRANSCERRIP